MSLSDCEKCWDTPCRCGYEYKKPYWTQEKKTELVEAVIGKQEANLNRLARLVADTYLDRADLLDYQWDAFEDWEPVEELKQIKALKARKEGE